MPERGQENAALVWDASALVAAVRADRIDVLETMVKGSRNVTTSLVVNELRNLGLTDTTWAHGWMKVMHLDELDEFDALVRWADRIGARSGHNRGRITVFALASHGSLWVFAETVNRGVKSGKSLCGLLTF